jgi:class 3 adenylate cyclase
MIEQSQIEAAITALEAQPPNLESPTLETTLTLLKQQLHQMKRAEIAQDAMKGERKQITIMFVDISGFTAMSEKLDPEEVRNLINACFEALGAVINRYDGYIDKFIGDEIMALFGAPIAHENDPERALRAALDMMEVLKAFNKQHADKIPKPLALHFGINSGLAIAGGIGTIARRDYSVMGDTVNLAARLEDLSETGEILVGEQTYRLTAPLFEFEPLSPVQVKGKEKPVQVYRLIRAATTRSQIRGIEGLSSYLVGRSSEFETLCSALAKLQEGQGRVISVVGEAGLGKSRLVQEARQNCQDSNLVWVEGQALSYGQDAGYLVARAVLCNLLGVSDEDSDDEIDAALKAEIHRCFPTRSAEVYPYLAYLLNVPLDEEAVQRVKYLTGEAIYQRIFQSVQDYLMIKASQKPLVLVWDDLHWVDPSSLKLLVALLPITETHPILFLLIYRTRRESRIWNFHQQVSQSDTSMQTVYYSLEIQPLRPEESHQLVTNLMGSSKQTQKLRELIVRKAEGNPFFIEEVIRSLIDNGALVRSTDETQSFVTTDASQEIRIPDTLQGVIMSRIDQLGPETKRILQVASIIGRTFPHYVLADTLKQLNYG